jgi:hypothetical protein
MPYANKEKEQAYRKSYREAHKAEIAEWMHGYYVARRDGTYELPELRKAAWVECEDAAQMRTMCIDEGKKPTTPRPLLRTAYMMEGK